MKVCDGIMIYTHTVRKFKHHIIRQSSHMDQKFIDLTKMKLEFRLEIGISRNHTTENQRIKKE